MRYYYKVMTLPWIAVAVGGIPMSDKGEQSRSDCKHDVLIASTVPKNVSGIAAPMSVNPSSKRL